MAYVNQLLAAKGPEVGSPEEGVGVLDRIGPWLPVLRGQELVGIVSERDYARKVTLLRRSSAETPVWQIMSTPVITVSPTATVRRCMEIMTESRIRHLPVVDDGRLIGVISIGDCVRHVIEEQQETIEQLEKFITG